MDQDVISKYVKWKAVTLPVKFVLYSNTAQSVLFLIIYTSDFPVITFLNE